MTRRTKVVLWTLVGVAVAVPVVYFTAPPPGQGGLTGRYWLYDDTGLPSLPADEGVFLVIPDATVHDVWPDKVDPDATRFNTFLADLNFKDLEEEYGASKVDVQRNGRFRVEAPPGQTVICWMSGPSGVFGCAELDLPENGSLKAESGEGGFWIGVQ